MSPWTAACLLILCPSLLLLPSIFHSIRVFSNEPALHIRWPKYWCFSFSISPSNEYSGLISFRIDWLDLHAVQGTLKSLFQHQFKSINSSALNLLYGPTLTSIRVFWKNHSFDYADLFDKVMSLFFNTLSRFVIAFLPRSKRLLVSWLQSPCAVILEPKKYPHLQITTVLTSIATCFTCSRTSTSQNYTTYSLLYVPFTEHCA